MSKWTIDEGILLDENCQAIACTWECEAATERNMQLLQFAPEMYEMLDRCLEELTFFESESAEELKDEIIALQERIGE